MLLIDGREYTREEADKIVESIEEDLDDVGRRIADVNDELQELNWEQERLEERLDKFRSYGSRKNASHELPTPLFLDGIKLHVFAVWLPVPACDLFGESRNSREVSTVFALEDNFNRQIMEWRRMPSITDIFEFMSSREAVHAG